MSVMIPLTPEQIEKDALRERWEDFSNDIQGIFYKHFEVEIESLNQSEQNDLFFRLPFRLYDVFCAFLEKRKQTIEVDIPKLE